MAERKSEKRNTLAVVLFAIYLAALSWLVLFKLQFSVPSMEEGRIINWIPFQGSLGDNGVIRFGEIRNNIFAFIPLGIYACLLKGNWSFVKKLIGIVALTVGFEATQFIFAIGRADATDVLSNTLGGLIGIGVYTLLFKWMKNKTNKVFTIFAAAITTIVLCLAAFLLVNHRWIRIQ